MKEKEERSQPSERRRVRGFHSNIPNESRKDRHGLGRRRKFRGRKMMKHPEVGRSKFAGGLRKERYKTRILFHGTGGAVRLKKKPPTLGSKTKGTDQRSSARGQRGHSLFKKKGKSRGRKGMTAPYQVGERV